MSDTDRVDPKFPGNFDVEIWIPGDRFEANLAADQKSASILDRKHGTRFSQIDAAGMQALRVVVDAASHAMDGKGSLRPKVERFASDVSNNRTLADVRDLEGKYRKNTFLLLSRKEMGELRELVYVLLENLEAAREEE